ncbi:hypothetical protein D9M71_355100 [compost metagenome]
MYLDAFRPAARLQGGETGQVAQRRGIAGVAQAHVRRQQLAGFHPRRGEGQQALGGFLVARRYRHRLVLALHQAQYRFHVEHRADAEEGAAQAVAELVALALLEAAAAHVAEIVGDDEGTELVAEFFQAGAHGVRVAAFGQQPRAFGGEHAEAAEHAAAVDHAQGEGAADAGRVAPLVVVLQQAEGGLGGVLEDRAALAGHGQADHVVEIGDQLVEEPVLGLGRGQRHAGVVRPYRGQLLGVEARGGFDVARIDDAAFTETDADGQDADVVGGKKFGGQVAGGIDNQANSHGVLLWSGLLAAYCCVIAAYNALFRPICQQTGPQVSEIFCSAAGVFSASCGDARSPPTGTRTGASGEIRPARPAPRG